MLINETITAHAWGNGKWVLHTETDRNILLNEKSFGLYRILRETQTYEDALARFNTAHGWNLDIEDFKAHIAKVFGGYGLLKEDFEIERPDMKNQYLKLKVQLINASWAARLAKPVSWLYAPEYFWKVAIILIAFIVSTALLAPAPSIEIKGSDLGGMAIVFYLTMLVHEVGHIAGCQNSGIKHGGIGFGFYFIMPVMYADVTNIWLANKERRIIANLGGIFNELLYSSVLLALYWFTGDAKLYLIAMTIAVFVVFELNPFVRFDGYWILSDLSNTPNLLRKSKTVLLKTLKGFWKGNENSLSKHELGLFIYGFINSSLLFLFMGIMLFNFRSEIFAFPDTVYHLVKNVLNGEWNIDIVNRKFLLILTFYIMMTRLLYSYLKKKSGALFIRADKATSGETRPLI